MSLTIKESAGDSIRYPAFHETKEPEVRARVLDPKSNPEVTLAITGFWLKVASAIEMSSTVRTEMGYEKRPELLRRGYRRFPVRSKEGIDLKDIAEQYRSGKIREYFDRLHREACGGSHRCEVALREYERIKSDVVSKAKSALKGEIDSMTDEERVEHFI